jgi:HD-GYP domain-containing protein (c-di-GMP phosphodiesterase class II)
MKKLAILHSDRFDPVPHRGELDGGNVVVAPLGTDVDASLRIVLVDHDLAKKGMLEQLSLPGTALIGVGLTDDEVLLADERFFAHLSAEPSTRLLSSTIRRAAASLTEKARSAELEHEIILRKQELEEINKIGIALSTVRDHHVLLEMILEKARELSRSDAGSLYLIEDTADGKALRWKLAQNDSIPVDFEEKNLPITKKSLAGYVALTGETLIIDDAYDPPAGAEYAINTSFDQATGYHTKSMLVVPLKNHADDIIGIVQLINRRREGSKKKIDRHAAEQEIIPFDESAIQLVRSLGGQAAVALENNILYDAIERLFEGFVTAAVTAIEQRDPTTSGHSFRVADLTVELARTVDALSSGRYAGTRFTPEQVREIRYASLLHDFGKVGVRENVLVKAKKLYPMQIDVIRGRFDFLMKSIEGEYQQKKIDYLMKHGTEGFDAFSYRLDQEMQGRIDKVRHDLSIVVKSNEPTVLPEGDFEYLQQLAKQTFVDATGAERPLLHPEEARILSIRKGNLDQAERGEIESHVTHTFEFLSKIPWTKDLLHVPNIAYAHHEKLNGRGYPRALPAEDIPIQSKMMTISDIYDALTANDRPYKRAVPRDRALDILRMEMNDGLLDSELVNLFVDAKIYERTATPASR